jgi:signal transduction histidine kinase
VPRAVPDNNWGMRTITRHRRWLAFLIPITAGVVVVVFVARAGPKAPAARVAVVALAVFQLATLATMRRYPERSMVASLAAGVGLQALWPDLGTLGLANLSMCALAALRPPRVSLWALGFMLALAPWPAVTRGAVAGLIAAGGPVISWSWGELLRTRQDRRRGEARRAVAEERARIARELHDVVAHNVSLIVVQAVAAEDVFDTQPELSRQALKAIETSGRAALGELRRMLGTVRPDSEENGNDPQPGLGQLEALAGSMRAAGLDVSVRVEGEPVALPAGVDLSAYRIVQEALTNTLRHARAGHASVSVRWSPAAVELEVVDDGRGAPGGIDGGGHGIVGMRERVALLGGTLSLGAGPQGGFRVDAELPIEGAR